jgi:hypothetical protein
MLHLGKESKICAGKPATICHNNNMHARYAIPVIVHIPYERHIWNCRLQWNKDSNAIAALCHFQQFWTQPLEDCWKWHRAAMAFESFFHHSLQLKFYVTLPSIEGIQHINSIALAFLFICCTPMEGTNKHYICAFQ